jgi:DNA-binding MarR family transcriptional regulator
MDKQFKNIYNLLQEIALHFGGHGINGECCDDLSFVEFMALKKVHGTNDFSIQEIGNSLGFTKSGGTRIVNRLEKKGYVLRKNSSIDGRVCCVAVTTKGMEAVSRIMEKYTDYLECVLKDLGPNEIKNIGKVLETLLVAVQKKEFLSIDC